jgi:cholesterol transport system auxiliary component
MNIRGRLLVGVVVWSATLVGCSLTKPQPEVRHYALALQLPEGRTNTAKTSLVIHPLTTRDPYDQERMVYRTSPYAFDFYNFHRWASLPAEQVTYWTRRYLQETGLFSQVFPTTDGHADVALGGRIRQFEEIDQESTWEAALGIEFWLIRPGEHSPFWFRSYSATKPASRRNPEAIAEAMSQGLADILQRLTTDLAPLVNAPPP